jgi:hypothetical protein
MEWIKLTVFVDGNTQKALRESMVQRKIYLDRSNTMDERIAAVNRMDEALMVAGRCLAAEYKQMLANDKIEVIL